MPSISDSKLSKFVLDNKKELLNHRRWFHQHPETSFKEFETSLYIQNYLHEIGANNQKNISTTGIICEIGSKGKIHSCRFNMDGLPIPEQNDLHFSSLYSGYSHSCGHDFELAWGLMIAKYFQINKPNGILRLIFQPAEEGPGEESHGKTGGQILAEFGAFDVDSVMSLHVEPEVTLGTISIIDGEVTCSAYDFDFILHGKTCHAAKPHQGLNPVPFMAELIKDVYNLQEEIKSEIKDDEGYVMITLSNVSTRLQNDKSDTEESINTIPEYSIIKGISRVRSKFVKQKLMSGLKKLEAKYNSLLQDCKLHIREVALATINDKKYVDNVISTAKNQNIKIISKRTTWRDDAGWASDKAPCAHGFVGVNDGVTTVLHSPKFNPNEEALEVGLKIFLGTLERNFTNFVK